MPTRRSNTRNTGQHVQFHATERDLPRARAYLARQGIDYKGNRPKQAQRLANKVARQVAAGLLPSRPDARGHGLTPEHPGRKPRQRLATATPRRRAPAGQPPLKHGTPQEYHAATRQEPYRKMSNGVELYETSSAKRLRRIINFLAAIDPDGRADLEVTYADGTKAPFFTGADHKRNGRHAINISVLKEMLDDIAGDMEALLEDIAGDEDYPVEPGEGGIVNYLLTFYPSAPRQSGRAA